MLLASLNFGPVVSASEPKPDRDVIKPERELLITSPAVVDSDLASYPGSWSFGGLIEELAGKEQASDCVRAWLNTWMEPQTANQQVVLPRRQIEEKVIRPWQERDGFKPGQADQWKPKLENAPFRLLAIVNRIDLCAPNVAGSAEGILQDWKRRGRENDFLRLFNQSTGNSFVAPLGTPGRFAGGYGGGDFVRGNFGEGRLVFGAVASDGAPLLGNWTIIFEYKLVELPDPQVGDRKPVGPAQWANEWHTLGSIEPGEPEFANRLEQITRKFTHRAESRKPVLGQLRTSEGAFGTGREFRQYSLEGSSLRLAPLTQTPAPAFLKARSVEQRLLGQFLHDQNEFILAGLHNLPASLPGRRESVPLIAASATTPPEEPGFHWDAGRSVSREARRIFSLNTCTGCHAGETGCPDGLHIHTRSRGEESLTSDFLRIGAPLRVNDPAVRGSKIEFREMEDRAAIMAALIETRDRARLAALRDVLRARLRRTH